MQNILYHFTTRYNLRKILKDNTLKISWMWKIRAVSLTRDVNFIKRSVYLRNHNTNAVILLDRDKLKCDYKIECFDFFGGTAGLFKEAEEVVRQDITDLDKYIIEIRKF